LRLVSALKLYWINRGLLQLGHQVTMEALGRADAQAHDAARCRTLFDAGQLGAFMGEYTGARRYLEESLAIARELGDKGRIVTALQPLALAALGQGDLVTARRSLEEGLALARELGNKRSVAATVNALAQLSRVEGNLDDAEPLYREVLQLARELGDREVVAVALLNLAMVAICRDAKEGPGNMLREVLAIVQETGSRSAGQSLLDVAAGLAAQCRQAERAARFFGAAEAQTDKTAIRRDPADAAFLDPLIDKARREIGPAAFAAAEAGGRLVSYEKVMVEVSGWLTGDSCGDA
jgi:tetratricopeptide (TPR) repeat protein